MLWTDWLLFLILLVATLSGLRQGFLRAACSLAGLFFGLLLAAWNYAALARLLLPLLRLELVANLVSFVLIVFCVTALANLLGAMLSRTARAAGLGCFDRLLGAALGFWQGWLFVTFVVLLAAAYFPHAHWLNAGRLPHFFFGSCDFGAHLSPAELANRVLQGLDQIRQQSPAWMHLDSTAI